MIQPIINPKNQVILDNLIEDLPQSLLISGDYGVGIKIIAEHIARSLNVKPTIILPESKEKIDIEKGIIGVDIIRRLYNQTKTKTDVKRIIIIDYVERMATRSQNAFLKLLEEPGVNTHFILVSHAPQKLLPTILSRVTIAHFLPITAEQSTDLIDSYKISDSKKRAQLLFIAQGLPAEIIRLIGDEDYFSKRSDIIRDARDMLGSNNYKKLLIANSYKDRRFDTLTLLTDIGKILRMSVGNGTDVGVMKRIDSSLMTYQRVEGNGNIRLCLARFVLQ